MDAQEITLNIAVNLGRLARWAGENKVSRIPFFLAETEIYLNQLHDCNYNSKFKPTLQGFSKKFLDLKKTSTFDEVWAEEALTWANILTHRAKLA